MLNDIFSYSNAFPSLDISATFSEMLDTNSWKTVLRILRHEQLPLLSSQSKNQEQIIAGLQSFLLMQPWKRYPLQWAFAHALLAVAYARRITGDKQANIAQANVCCDRAMTVLTRENEPQPWALLQLTRGEICRNLPPDERQKNLTQALEYCQQALQVHIRATLPFQWAFTHATLGHVYSEIYYCISEQSETLDLAFDHYQQALQVIKEENSPIQWAIIQQGLVLVAIMRQDHLKAERLQQAITLGQSSLRVLTRSTYPTEWAKVHAYLGEAYRQAAGYEELQELYSGQAVMQEQALRHIEAALQVYTMHDYHFEWTKVKKFEGMIYQERIRGKRSENREQARCCFRAASSSAATK